MKKVYAFVTCNRSGLRYAAHIPEWSKAGSLDFGEVVVVSKDEYRRARASGMPSWGERETAAKMRR